MYVLGFIASYLLFRRQLRERRITIDKDFVEGLYTALILGLILGGRIGYVLFYNPSYYLSHPVEIIAINQGGMSFHGALIGTVLAGIYYGRKHSVNQWLIADCLVATAPIGLGLGRIGNFINGELYGRVTDVPWAMIFPGETLPRHPSQLYEFTLEGVALFIILWSLRGKFRDGILTGLFLVLYGVFRSIVEFFREPDVQIGYIAGFITMGQLLCLVMIVAGIALIRYRRHSGAATKL